jgi:hypothetical protein
MVTRRKAEDGPSMADGRGCTSDAGRVTTVRFCPLETLYHTAQLLPDANCRPFIYSLTGRTDRGLWAHQFGAVDPFVWSGGEVYLQSC